MQELTKVSDEVLMSKIYLIRGQKVMLERFSRIIRRRNQSVKSIG